MSYIGTLKAWLYRPIVSIFGTESWQSGCRCCWRAWPACGSSSCSCAALPGERAAIIGCTLLAVDSSYLLTICFDWGPVALQHLLEVAGLLLLVRFYQQRGHRRAILQAASCWAWQCGIKPWRCGCYRAVGVAAAALFPGRILRLVTRRRVAIALLGFRPGSSAADRVQRRRIIGLPSAATSSATPATSPAKPAC